MNPLEPSWETRANRVTVSASWVALTLGILVAVLVTEGSPLALVASGAGAIWVLAITAMPRGLIRRTLVLELLVVSGVLTTMTAVALTDTTSSAFLLLSLTPSIYAAIQGGFRTGLATAALSAAVFAILAFAQGADLLQAGTIVLLYLLIGITIAYLRRLLADTEARAARASQSSAAAQDRLASLESAHSLLTRLAAVTSNADSSPVAVGRSALELVCAEFLGSSGIAVIEGDQGPIVVARHGTTPDPSYESNIPLVSGDRNVGVVRLRTNEPLRQNDLDRLETALRPLALAFFNTVVLQQISQHAVTAERVRLARDLHDDIGPGLASLGLSLDLALLQGASEGELTQHIEQLRERVSELVDEVRTTVTDLRSGSASTLSSIVAQIMGDLSSGAEMTYEVDERRPIRPSLCEPVGRIAGEALRNAVNHANAQNIRVTGWVDFDRGRVAVTDDGNGFDPNEVRSGHYGLIGMQERGNDAGVEVDVVSGEDGTRVLIEWSSRG